MWLTKYTAIYRMTPLNESPEVLRAQARDVIKKLGYTRNHWTARMESSLR